jgi:drug/metabolite transporter (DMT)-like permease
MSKQLRLYIALITLSLIWGVSFLFIKVLLDYMTPFGIVFFRCLFGVVTLLVILWWSKEIVKLKELPIRSLIFVGLLNAAIPWALIAYSEMKISSSMAAVLNATTPIWTSVIGVLFFAIHLKWKQWVGILIGFFGITILLDLNIAALVSEDFVGVGTMLLATVCYGLSSQYTKRYLKDVSIKVISLMTLLVGAAISLIMSFIFDPINVSAIINPLVFGSFIALGVFGSGFAYLLFYYCIKEGSAEFATLVTYLVPISAMIWGFIILDEAITPNLIVGLLFIFFGVYLASMKKKPALTKTTKTYMT